MERNSLDEELKFIRHSDEINEIITSIPSKLVRWGTVLFLLVFIAIISLSWMVKFPDIVRTRLSVKSTRRLDKDSLIGVISLSQNAASKINPGESVLIKFDAYPYEHYGVIKGTIQKISTVINDRGEFSSEVRIDVSSDYKNRSIVLWPGMLANAEVITQNVSMLQRITSTIFERQQD